MRLPRIGIFDSGIGGFSVLRPCMQRIKGVYYYYGDNARAPYGNRKEEEIVSFVREALSEFERRGVDAAILACNTATAVCLDKMRREFSFPILGAEPAVCPAARLYQRIAVLATPVTAGSERLHALISRFPGRDITVIPLPHLAEAIERHFLYGETLSLSEHLPPLFCDCAVLGCTHYALVREEIQSFLGIPALDGGEGIARRLRDLIKVGIERHLCPPTKKEVYLSQKYNKEGQNLLICLGSGKKLNKRFYQTNIQFSKN